MNEKECEVKISSFANNVKIKKKSEVQTIEENTFSTLWRQANHLSVSNSDLTYSS